MTEALIKAIKKINPELIVWCGGLLFLFFSQRYEGLRFTVCPLKLMGFEHCPGCGLGTSVGLLLNGQLAQSFEAHPLGAFALIILSIRIFTLIKNNYGTSIKTPAGIER